MHLNKFTILRYCYSSFKQLKKDPLHVLTDAYVLVFSRYRPKHFCLQMLFAPIRNSPIYNLCISSLIFEHRKCLETRFRLNSVFRNVRRDIIDLYTFIMYICWDIKCLLYVYSFSLMSNMSIVLLYTVGSNWYLTQLQINNVSTVFSSCVCWYLV